MSHSSLPWQLIPIEEYARPTEPASETVLLNLRDQWLALRRWLRAQLHSEEEEYEAPELRSAPQRLLNWAAPQPQWSTLYHDALDDTLGDWLAQDAREAGVRVVVDAPFNHLDEAVAAWGQAHDFVRIEPPSIDEVLSGGGQWLEHWLGQTLQFDEQNAPTTRFVLPHLHRCYLRHHDGLTLMRQLLDNLFKRPYSGLIFCDSWSWAYLCNVLNLSSFFDHVLTPCAFDADALAHWFTELSQQSPPSQYVFRQADNGKPVLAREHTEQDDPPLSIKQREISERSDFLTYIATRSRGNPGIAWALWRYSLRVASDEQVADKVQEAAESDHGTTVWVAPWEQLDLPSLPPHPSTEEAFVLHALLIHGGLKGSALPVLIPFSPSAIIEVAQGLKRRGVIEQVGELDERTQTTKRWRVHVLAYANVRAFLKNEGYLMDGL